MERPATVGVVTVAHGETYRSMLCRWAEAVAALERAPDFVTVVTDDPDCPHVRSAARLLGPEFLALPGRGSFEHHPQVLVNEGIAVTPADWICKMDADDVILPHALGPLDGLDADVLMFGIRHGGQDLQFSGVDAEAILRRDANLVFSGSPFRRELWEGNPFRDMVYEDWAFWIGCARRGAEFRHSGTIDYVYTIHDAQISRRADDARWAREVRSLP